MSVLTGKEFNEKYGDKTFVKLTNKEEKHNGYEFKSGLNVDTVPFDPQGSCRAGGIYFCELGKLSKWLEYGYQRMYYARVVSIPDDAQVYEEEDKWKADKLVLGERRTIAELEIWKDREYCMAAVKLNGNILEYVQTPEVCLEAVKRNGIALGFVKNQTEALCLAAVKRESFALEYVKNQTEEICMEAVRQNGISLHYVKNQTEEICLEAVRQNGYALQSVRNQTGEICMEAVRQNGWALEYVRDQTKKICMEAISHNGNALKYVKIKL